MKKNTGKYIIVIVLLLLIIGGGIYLVFGMDTPKSPNENEKQKSNESTSIVRKDNIIKTVSGAAEIKAGKSEKISLNKNYKFKEIYVEVGDTVKKGDKILKYTNGKIMYAPYDCVINAIDVPKTNKMCFESNYIEILDVSILQTEMEVYEGDISKIKIGQEVNVKLSAFDDKTYKGKIVKIDPIGKYNASGSKFKIQIEIENDGNIKIGMSSTCEVIIGEAKDVLIVPIDAVKTVDEKKYVTVKNSDGTTKQVEVKTGISDDNNVEVTGELKEGDIIVFKPSSSNNGLTGGMNITTSVGGISFGQ